MKTALLFDHFGPYHLARLRAAGEDVFGIEFFSRSCDYAWSRADFAGVRVITLSPHPEKGLDNKTLCVLLKELLTKLQPDIVAIPGWSSLGALAALEWCLSNQKPTILMSESSEHDESRRYGKEFIKRRLVALFSSALVGGSSHASYLRTLGMPAKKIFLGYDAVDNGYFSRATEKETRIATSSPFFLASARFIPKKNLFTLLQAYARYRINKSTKSPMWDLVLLGDGPLRGELEKLVKELGLESSISMPGFKQYAELPAYYARASAFIHSSIVEQWGLVVNEAMAAGLPVIVSERCGCASDLVKEGRNGLIFDPLNEEALAKMMTQIAMMPKSVLAEMGKVSQELIESWGPSRFADGLLKASKIAVMVKPRSFVLWDRLLLKLLCFRCW